MLVIAVTGASPKLQGRANNDRSVRFVTNRPHQSLDLSLLVQTGGTQMTMLKKLSVATAVTACLLVPAAAFARGGGHGGHGGAFKVPASMAAAGKVGITVGTSGALDGGATASARAGAGPRPPTFGSAATDRCRQLFHWRRLAGATLREAAFRRPLRARAAISIPRRCVFAASILRQSYRP